MTLAIDGVELGTVLVIHSNGVVAPDTIEVILGITRVVPGIN